MFKTCSHEDSRLKCTECEAAICSNCMVECPVGFKCKPCLRSRDKGSKESVGSRFFVAKALGASALVGLASGWLMPFVAIPYISCFICFFLGIYSGRWLANHIDRRLGHKTALTIVFGVLIGMSLTPMQAIPTALLTLVCAPFKGVPVFDCLHGMLGLLFDPVCFFAGLLRPTVWGEFR